jgi:hypothetical protein
MSKVSRRRCWAICLAVGLIGGLVGAAAYKPMAAGVQSVKAWWSEVIVYCPEHPKNRLRLLEGEERRLSISHSNDWNWTIMPNSDAEPEYRMYRCGFGHHYVVAMP